MWISKQEYEEGGKACVDKKCPWLVIPLRWVMNCFKTLTDNHDDDDDDDKLSQYVVDVSATNTSLISLRMSAMQCVTQS